MTRIVDDPSSKELDGLDHITAQEATHGSIPAKRAENVMLSYQSNVPAGFVYPNMC